MTPRPGALVPLAFGAGLATGLLHFGVPAGVLALFAARLRRRRADDALVLGAVALGALAGVLTRWSDAASCRARLPPARIELTVRLLDPPAPRGVVRARIPAAGCRGPVDVRWPDAPGESGAARAGSVARVTGRWIPRTAFGGRAGGMLVVARAQVLASRPGLADRMRNSVTASALHLYGSRAPLVDALVLGTRGGIDPALRDRFAYSGLVHLLSISGFHVGLLSAWVVMFLRLAGVRRERALLTGAAAGLAYVAFLGWPAPGTRAAALALFLSVQFARQRRVESTALLTETCLVVLLVEPWSIFDLGGWLSAGALWGATTATRWSDATIGERFLPRTLASSVGATLATAPITAMALGTVAVAGIALNLAAIPLAALAVPGVVASLVVAPLWEPLAEALAAGSGALLHALEALAGIGAAVPGGHVVMAAEPRAALPWLGVLAAALWAAGRRNTIAEALRRASLVAAAWVWLALGTQLSPGAGDAHRGLTLHFLDVGQGDGAAIRTPGGRWILVDAGPKSGSYDAGRRVVAPFLARHGARRLAVLFVSHAHLDHLGGVGAVLNRLGADVVIEPADQVPDPVYTGFLDEVEGRGIPWRAGRPGVTLLVDGVRLTVLHPDTSWAEWGADVNEDSIVLRVDFGAFTAVLAGDAGLIAESRLRGRVGRADILKVGHHGSRGASGDRWLDELRPEVAVVSVGQNRYGHPAPEALARLGRHGADVWRTDREGTITVTTDGATMTIRGRRGATTYSVQ